MLKQLALCLEYISIIILYREQDINLLITTTV